MNKDRIENLLKTRGIPIGATLGIIASVMYSLQGSTISLPLAGLSLIAGIAWKKDQCMCRWEDFYNTVEYGILFENAFIAFLISFVMIFESLLIVPLLIAVVYTGYLLYSEYEFDFENADNSLYLQLGVAALLITTYFIPQILVIPLAVSYLSFLSVMWGEMK